MSSFFAQVCVHQRELKYWLSLVHPPLPPVIQSEAAAGRQSCQCEAAVRNRAELSAFARHTVSESYLGG
ncbi:uncharacterized protein LOC108898778 [Lates japonicus]